MRSAKGSSSVQEEEEFDEDENSAKKETHNNNNSHATKDSKSTDKASAMRSKHSVTEQRRRCKINERLQILRDIIPHSDQKRDTASFLSEVIDYVQHLQERVKTYDCSFPGTNSEPTKLMPWRNSHWRVQSLLGPQQAINNCSGPGSAFSGKLDENNISIAQLMLPHAQNSTESETTKVMDRQVEFTNKGPLTMPSQANIPHVQRDCMLAHSLQQPVSDVQLNGCPITDTHSQQEDVFIEGGTINISSAYSHGLLSNLTHALQSTGVDLSQANISLQIDLGKRANREITPGTSIFKTHEDPPSNHATMLSDSVSGEDHVQKRPRT